MALQQSVPPRARQAALESPAGARLLQLILGPCGLAILFAGAVTALFGTVGADFRWAAELGRIVLDRGVIPHGVPFAAAPSSGWHNVPVLAELVAARMTDAFGERGLYLLQLAAVLLAFGALARAMRRTGATEGGAAVALLLLTVGSFGAVVVARLQLFSLALFAVVLVVLHSVGGGGTPRRLWALPLVFALWANLHGAVLVGVGVTALYLAFERFRRRPAETTAILIASLGALLATPAFLQTPDYFFEITRSEAAVQGAGLWAPLSTSPLDIVFILAALVAAAIAWRGRPRPWELAAGLALAVLTVHTARSGVWFLMLAAVPAARGLRAQARLRPVTAAALATVLCAGIVVGVARGPLAAGAGSSLVHAAVAKAGPTPILAQDVIGEQVVLDGGTILLGNPLDAFSRRDQRLYLAWTSGKPSGDELLRRVSVVIVHSRTAAARRMASAGRFRLAGRDGGAILYVARAAPKG